MPFCKLILRIPLMIILLGLFVCFAVYEAGKAFVGTFLNEVRALDRFMDEGES